MTTDGSDLRRELHSWRYKIELSDKFFSILLGENQTPDLALHTTLWLPRYLEKRAATFQSGGDFIDLMWTAVFGEVVKFGTKATGIVQVFATIDLDLAERLLSKRTELRAALQKIADSVDTRDGEPSGVDLGVSRLELQPPRVYDLVSIIRYRYNVWRQFYMFLSILLGEDTPHGGEPATPPVSWLPDVIKKERAGNLEYNTHEVCFKLLMWPFIEVVKFTVRATDVTQAFAKMDIVHVENLLANPAALQSTFSEFNKITEYYDDRILIDMFIPPLKNGPSTVYALPDNLLPNVEPLDDEYIKFAVLRHYSGKAEDED